MQSTSEKNFTVVQNIDQNAHQDQESTGDRLGAGSMRWGLLAILTSINILNYIDRNIFSALVPALKRDLGFSDTQLGLLGSAFILAYTLVAPLFGYWGDRTARPRLMAAGLGVWSVATAATGFASTFVTQFAARVSVGLGEAAYSVISPSVIADAFSRRSRGKIFALYSCAIPVGSALGYVLGGWLEPRVGWSRAFFVVGVPGVVLAIALAFVRDRRQLSTAIQRDNTKPSSAKESLRTQFLVYKDLLSNGSLMHSIWGYTAYTFVVGGLAFWMPAYIVRYFDGVSLEKGNVVFGAVTVVGGFIGTAIGGIWADRWEKRSGNGYLKVCFCSMALAVPLFIAALSFRDFNSFCAALFVLDVAIFICISPIDAAVITFARVDQRATAMAFNIFVIHAFGDGVSRVLMGTVSDQFGLRSAVLLLPWVLSLAGFIWIAGVIRYFHAPQWPRLSIDLPKFQSHRGRTLRLNGSQQERDFIMNSENTMAAFRQARVHGALMCECDVRLTRDKQVIVYHDDSLLRFVPGDKRRVDEIDFAELRQLLAVPLLSELLSADDVPAKINIELKTGEIWGRSQLERLVVELIKEAKANDRVIVSSFNPLSLMRMARLAPHIPRALLVTQAREPGNAIYLRKMWLGFLARPHLLHVDDAMANARQLTRWRERGLLVAVWTVNSIERARELLSLGAVSVISDLAEGVLQGEPRA